MSGFRLAGPDGRASSWRVVLALALVAPTLAGCLGASIDPEAFDPSVPRCVGLCARAVDDSGAYAIEPYVAVDPLDPQHIVVVHIDPLATDEHGSGLTADTSRVSVTEDGGETWTTSAIPDGVFETARSDPLTAWKAGGVDPVLAFLPDGTLVMSALTTSAGRGPFAAPVAPVVALQGSIIYTVRSTDGGHTWGDARIVDRGGDGVVALSPAPSAGALWKFNDKPWITAGPDGTLLIAWSQLTYMHPETGSTPEVRQRLLSSSSEDGGLAWSSASVIDDDGALTGASPVIGRDGGWRIAYVDASEWELRFAESDDRGKTWKARTIGATSWLPAMRAQTLSSGVERLLLAYGTGGDWFEGEHRTEFTWSDDGGESWAPPLILDLPDGDGPSFADAAPGAGDGAWVTYFDVEGPRAEQNSRYMAVKVVDGVAGAPLVLEEIATAALNLGHYFGLATLPNGDAIAAWVTRQEGDQDVVWARITGGDEPVPQPSLRPPVPDGLSEAVQFEFAGHVNVPYHCLPAGHGDVEDATFAQHSAAFEFEVPEHTRFLNGTLGWETTGPTAETSDLDVAFFDPNGGRLVAARLDETSWSSTSASAEFTFELHGDAEGPWTAVVTNCQNPPTDFTLEVLLS